MPKTKRDPVSLKKSWLHKLSLSKIMRLDGAKFVCLPCEKSYSFNQISELQQHINSRLHKGQTDKFNLNPQRQILLSSAINNLDNSSFTTDMCAAFLSAGIPWKKLNNPRFHNFLEKYTKKNIPDESTFRKNYLPKLYAEAIESIREDIGNCPVWIAVDERTDVCGNYIANVLVGTLKTDEVSKTHIVASKQLPATNNRTITKLILDIFNLLWPGCKQEEIEKKFLLFLTDGVPYMIKAGKNLKALYPDLLHITCLAHGINRVVEEVRSNYQDVDRFIANMKAAFLKSTNRVVMYKELLQNFPLPPHPVVTRWGTWLKAVKFYAENFDEIKSVVETIEPNAASIRNVQSLLHSTDLRNNLAYLEGNFTFLAVKLVVVQEQGGSLAQFLSFIQEVQDQLSKVTYGIGPQIQQKFNRVICKNPDFAKLTTVKKILEGGQGDLDISLSPKTIAELKYAPITTVDAERSFSMHKILLSEKRRNMTPENLEMELICHFEL